MRRIGVIGAALAAAALCFSSAACTQKSIAPPGAPMDRVGAEPADAIGAVVDTIGAVTDALNVAPPATLSRTTIDEKAVHAVFKLADTAFTIIDSLGIVKNSPKGVALRAAVLKVKGALIAVSDAQRAGNATTYSEALRQAKTALTSLKSVIAK